MSVDVADIQHAIVALSGRRSVLNRERMTIKAEVHEVQRRLKELNDLHAKFLIRIAAIDDEIDGLVKKIHDHFAEEATE